MFSSLANKDLYKKCGIVVVILSLFACGGEFNNSIGASYSAADSNQQKSSELTAYSDAGPSDGISVLPNTPEQVAALQEAEENYKNLALQEANVNGLVVHYKTSNINLGSDKTLGASSKVIGLSANTGDVSAQQNAKASLVQYQQVATSLDLGLKASHAFLASGAELLLNKTITIQKAEQLGQLLMAVDSRIESFEPNVLFQSSALTQGQTFADNMFYKQWGLNQVSETLTATGQSYGINPEYAWTKTTGETIVNVHTGSPVVVAVLDSGSKDHQDLTGQYLGGYDFVSKASTSKDGDGRDNNPNDPGDSFEKGFCGKNIKSTRPNSTWHGTQVASVIAALANNTTSTSQNAVGMVGVAPLAKILPVRVAGPCGASLTDVADAIRWAAGAKVVGVPDNLNPAKVINVSFEAAGASCSKTLSNAIKVANDLGAVVVVPAGNSSKIAGVAANYTMPANCTNAITVGAIKHTGERADYTNFGSPVDVSAPGQDILVANFEDDGVTSNYLVKSGSSLAAAHASGVLALMYAVKPDLSATAAANYLKLHVAAIPTITKSKPKPSGTGLVDASRVIKALTSIPTLTAPNDLRATGHSEALWLDKETNSIVSTSLSFQSNPSANIDPHTTSTQVLKVNNVEPVAALEPKYNVLTFAKLVDQDYYLMTRPAEKTIDHEKISSLQLLSDGSNLPMLELSQVSVPKSYSPLGKGYFFNSETEGIAYRDIAKSSFVIRKFQRNSQTLSGNQLDVALDIKVNVSSKLKLLGFADFNSDGFTDVLWQQPTGVLTILYVSENAFIWQDLSGAGSPKLPKGYQFFALGDFVGDNQTDIVFRNKADSSIAVLKILDSGQQQLIESEIVIDIPTGSTYRIGDFNGDKKNDILVIRKEDATLPWHLSSFSFDATTALLKLPVEQTSEEHLESVLTLDKYRPI